MKKNVGGLDKALRIAMGIILSIVGIFGSLSIGMKTVVFLVAAIALFTGIFGV
ncbi:MAG: DUF2892 domain-containing protein [Thermodesulfovibrionales bacterium]